MKLLIYQTPSYHCYKVMISQNSLVFDPSCRRGPLLHMSDICVCKSVCSRSCTGNESVPIQLAQCWFTELAISNAKI